MSTRKEAVRAYHERKRQAGVLAVRHLASGRVWFDAAPDLPARENRHRFQLELGNHPVADLQADWKAFGADAFGFEVVGELPPRAEPATPQQEREDLEALLALCLEARPAGELRYGRAAPS